MSTYQPLSVREGLEPGARFDELHEGFPSWLWQSTFNWLDDSFNYAAQVVDSNQVRQIERALRLEPPLDWFTPARAYADLGERMKADGLLALNVLDYVIAHPNLLSYEGTKRSRLHRIEALTRVLYEGGSAWEPTAVDDGGRWVLTRRVAGPAREAVEAVGALSSRVGSHLSLAWQRLYRRDPDTQAAYLEAVRAVEAAAKPVVAPDAARATLGTMISAIRDKPEKWTFELGPATAVADMAALLWTAEYGRHGTDDDSVPISVSYERAEAGIHLAITLCRFFVSNAFKRV